MAEQPQAEESVVSQPTYKTDETAQAFSNLLNQTAKTEEPQPATTEEKESNLEEDQVELLEEDVDVNELVDDDETALESPEELYDVTIDGKLEKVPLNELLKGYSRESSFTKKSQELSNSRRELETQQEGIKTELDAVKQTRNEYAEKLKVLTDSLNVDQNIDWVKLAQEDPQNYAIHRAEYDKNMELKQIAEQEQQRVLKEQKIEQEKIYSKYILNEKQLLSEKLPIYKDEVKGKEFVKNITNFAKELGYKDQELSMLVDHRAVLMLADAYRYNQLKKTKLANKKVTKAPKSVSSNAANVSQASENSKIYKDRFSKLKQSGSMKDAQSVLKEMYFGKE
jgi:hypothetical protein